MADLMAKMLWECKAVHFRPEEPYKLASGLHSQVYTIAASCCPIRASARPSWILPQRRCCPKSVSSSSTASPGGETAAFRLPPFGRPAGAGDDLCAQAAEGSWPRRADRGRDARGCACARHRGPDLGGGTSIFTFINAVRAAGGVVDHGMALFFYGIFPEAEARFVKARSRCTTSPPGGTC